MKSAWFYDVPENRPLRNPEAGKKSPLENFSQHPRLRMCGGAKMLTPLPLGSRASAHWSEPGSTALNRLNSAGKAENTPQAQ